MAITKAQDALLRKLENGSEVSYREDHYIIITAWNNGKGEDAEKIWPSTFYGLYDNRMVEKLPNGNYTISDYGKQQIRSKNK